MSQEPSLRERILAAENTEDITTLLALGESEQYKNASPRTRSRWRSAAKRRRKELAS